MKAFLAQFTNLNLKFILSTSQLSIAGNAGNIIVGIYYLSRSPQLTAEVSGGLFALFTLLLQSPGMS